MIDQRNGISGMRHFNREDLSKPENRVNWMLFAAQAVPAFRDRAWRMLDLQLGAVLRRVVIESSTLRPDFIAVTDGRPTCWLEVELSGRRDSGQEKGYVATLNLPLRWILGPAQNLPNDPSLEALAKLAENVAIETKATDPHAAEILLAFVEAVQDGLLVHRPRPQQMPIPDRIKLQPWFAVMAEPLLELLSAGIVVNRPTHPESISLRLQGSPVVRASGRQVALISQRANAPSVVRVASPNVLHRTLTPELASWVADWRRLLDRTRPGWEVWVDRVGRIDLPVADLPLHAVAFASVFADLRRRLLS
jgi:hypothetical protein